MKYKFLNKIVKITDTRCIDSWYDRNIRSWTLLVCDNETKNQIGAASYAANHRDADLQFERLSDLIKAGDYNGKFY